MLRSLDIRDMQIIDRMEIGFRPGLNVLTGETGAGKSILLDALGFALGWRGRGGPVRSGARQGEVTAVFDLTGDHPALEILSQAGLPSEDELILRRVNATDGRKTAWVNDRRVSGEVLRALSRVLVELHGRRDGDRLLNPRGHRALLDAYGELDSRTGSVRAAWQRLERTRSEIESARVRLDSARSEEDFLRHAMRELDDLAPETGEDAELDARRRLMQDAGRIREDVRRATMALGSEGAEGMAGEALRWLEGVGGVGAELLEEGVSALGRALVELDEARRGVERCLESLSFDPAELESVEERLFAIRGLARKHDVLPDDLGAFAADLRARLERMESGSLDIARLESDMQDAQARHGEEAVRLSAERKKAAEHLDAAMAGELAPLKMERAVFRTEIADAAEGPEGRDAVTFTITTNPGAPAGPLNRIASGGELSRFLLALKVCLRAGRPGVTMVFDEIDRGVGGAAATAVGRRLKSLAEGAQVLAVTHSPQVAALSDHHWRVVKAVSSGRTVSSASCLEAEERVDELARMLSGDTVTEEARAAAGALLQE